MVQNPRQFAGARLGATFAFLLFFGAACQTPQPVNVNANFVSTPAFNTRSPSQVAVLPIEDGTADGAIQRHLTLLRQEVMRQLPSRLYTPLTASAVDAALTTVPAPAAGESILVPATLQKLAGHAAEDAVLALRVDRWDEGRLMVDKTVWFQFQAALVGSDGVQLWSGTIAGEVKAGGLGPSPRDKDGMARSCAELAVREMMLRMPRRAP
ncbi:MAG: hypothetical protein JNK15_14420 [Planctomycetes bacterium]|nr:hypothetical protein [Planctomycetota bacterium]